MRLQFVCGVKIGIGVAATGLLVYKGFFSMQRRTIHMSECTYRLTILINIENNTLYSD